MGWNISQLLKNSIKEYIKSPLPCRIYQAEGLDLFFLEVFGSIQWIKWLFQFSATNAVSTTSTNSHYCYCSLMKFTCCKHRGVWCSASSSDRPRRMSERESGGQSWALNKKGSCFHTADRINNDQKETGGCDTKQKCGQSLKNTSLGTEVHF